MFALFATHEPGVLHGERGENLGHAPECQKLSHKRAWGAPFTHSTAQKFVCHIHSLGNGQLWKRCFCFKIEETLGLSKLYRALCSATSHVLWPRILAEVPRTESLPLTLREVNTDRSFSQCKNLNYCIVLRKTCHSKQKNQSILLYCPCNIGRVLIGLNIFTVILSCSLLPFFCCWLRAYQRLKNELISTLKSKS